MCFCSLFSFMYLTTFIYSTPIVVFESALVIKLNWADIWYLIVHSNFSNFNITITFAVI